MSFKVKIGVMEIELDSIEQVAELARHLDKEPKQLTLPQPKVQPPISAPKNGGNAASNSWDRESAWQFMSSLTGTAKSFLGHLLAVRTISSGEMAKKIDVEPNLLGPAIRSIKSKCHGLDKKLPFEIQPQPSGVGKTYVMTFDFYNAASQPAQKQ